MSQDVMSLLKAIAKSQHDNNLRALECLERVFSVEATLVALDARAQPLLEKIRSQAHEANEKPRRELEMWLAAIESFSPQKPS
jgi:hypothetical protein